MQSGTPVPVSTLAAELEVAAREAGEIELAELLAAWLARRDE